MMKWMEPFNGMFTNEWYEWIFNNYLLFFAHVSAIFYAALKIWAYRHPEVPTDKILDLVKVIFGRPNITK